MELSQHNPSIKKITISGQNISGPVDLSGFKNLESFDCANNQITKISNIPPTLCKLNCSNNLITGLYLQDCSNLLKL
jgi:hypothetical protein